MTQQNFYWHLKLNSFPSILSTSMLAQKLLLSTIPLNTKTFLFVHPNSSDSFIYVVKLHHFHKSFLLILMCFAWWELSKVSAGLTRSREPSLNWWSSHNSCQSCLLTEMIYSFRSIALRLTLALEHSVHSSNSALSSYKRVITHRPRFRRRLSLWLRHVKI